MLGRPSQAPKFRAEDNLGEFVGIAWELFCAVAGTPTFTAAKAFEILNSYLARSSEPEEISMELFEGCLAKLVELKWLTLDDDGVYSLDSGKIDWVWSYELNRLKIFARCTFGGVVRAKNVSLRWTQGQHPAFRDDAEVRNVLKKFVERGYFEITGARKGMCYAWTCLPPNVPSDVTSAKIVQGAHGQTDAPPATSDTPKLETIVNDVTEKAVVIESVPEPPAPVEIVTADPLLDAVYLMQHELSKFAVLAARQKRDSVVRITELQNELATTRAALIVAQSDVAHEKQRADAAEAKFAEMINRAQQAKQKFLANVSLSAS